VRWRVGVGIADNEASGLLGYRHSPLILNVLLAVFIPSLQISHTTLARLPLWPGKDAAILAQARSQRVNVQN
jgi:hypothetical protein